MAALDDEFVQGLLFSWGFAVPLAGQANSYGRPLSSRRSLNRRYLQRPCYQQTGPLCQNRPKVLRATATELESVRAVAVARTPSWVARQTKVLDFLANAGERSAEAVNGPLAAKA